LTGRFDAPEDAHMALDPKKVEAWKVDAEHASPSGCVYERQFPEVLAALLAEVERLRSESGLVRDPAGGEPPSWVRIEVRAHDPEQRKRTAEWIRRADEDNAAMRALLREVQEHVIAWSTVEGVPPMPSHLIGALDRLAAFLR
jgi:hypothetical protein